jgi:signal transduction histidine kinase
MSSHTQYESPIEADKTPSQETLALRFALGVLLVLGLSLLAFYAVMRPSSQDLVLMTLFLSVTAVISLVAGYGVLRLGWLDRLPSIRLSLLAGYVLSSLLTFVNIWLTANLMFASPHDLLLATVLLLFASGIAIVLGGFLSSALVRRVQRLQRAAQAIAGGRLETRVPHTGQDELAALGATFNHMAERLEDIERQTRELESLRRDLIAWVSHDLQTPLASIRAVLEALSDGVVDDPATAQRYLDTAQKDVRALSLLIDDLFQMAQIDAGGLRLDCADGSISDIVSDTLETFAELAERKHVQLTGDAQRSCDPVWMDTPRIGRALVNLVGNAVRHTPRGGEVRVQVQCSPEGVQVEVADTGEGLPAEDLPYVFERFYRGEKSRSRATGGAGLGLAIARGIVEAHGGRIWAENRPEGGALFVFTLPGRP